MSTNSRTVVIGLGNPIMGDDGVGLAALGALTSRFEFDGDIAFMDGGTWGMQLLPDIEDAGSLLLLDAIDAGVEPGTLVELEHDAIPRYLSSVISPHQIDLSEVIALAELRGTLPRRTVALGIQPGPIHMSVSLSDAVESQVDALAQAAAQRLASWGHTARQLASHA